MTTSSSSPLPPEAYLSWVEVNLSAIIENYRTIRQRVPEQVDVFPVVKADAYGHGAVRVCEALAGESIQRFCVARVEEAVELRKHGLNQHILVFAPPFYAQALVAAQNRLELVVCDPVHLEAVERAQRETGNIIPIHLKTDVGMGRMGVAPGQLLALFNDCRSRRITVRGVMTHFPCADVCDGTLTREMVKLFHKACDEIRRSSGNTIIFHTSNTAAILRFPEAQFDAVRLGIGLYGQYPDVSMERNIPLSPAMGLKSRVSFIKSVPAGTPVSYCQTWASTRPSRLATVPLGYADGYPRHASSKTEFLIQGKRVPQVGRVCMDQLILDITDVPGVQIGDEVMAFGIDSNGHTLRAEEVASQFGSIGYELTTRIGKRLPRFYIETASGSRRAQNSRAGRQ